MECISCGINTAVSARFCQNCGNNLISEDEVIAKQDITLDFLKGILSKLGYKSEDANGETESAIFKRENSYNFLISINQLTNIKLTTARMLFNIKKPSWNSKTELFVALNKANNTHWLYTFSVTDKIDSLCVTSFICLTGENIFP